MTASAGLFLALEGLDGSGGTTQLNRLALRIAALAPDRELVLTREPSDGPVGRLIRAQLLDGEVGDGVLPYLFAADRRDHLDRVVLPALSRGAVVLSDRYALSSFAYQSEAAGMERVMALNADFPAPTLTLMLDLDPERAVERVVRRGQALDRFENLGRQRRVAAGYERALAAVAERGWPVTRIDASQTVDAVAASVWKVVGPLLGVRA